MKHSHATGRAVPEILPMPVPKTRPAKKELKFYTLLFCFMLFCLPEALPQSVEIRTALGQKALRKEVPSATSRHATLGVTDTQTFYVLHGQVRGKYTDEPIEGARILIKGSPDYFFSGADGNFSVPSTSESGILEIFRSGYAPIEKDFENGELYTSRSVVFLQKESKGIQPILLGDSISDELWDFPLEVVNHEKGRRWISLREYADRKLIILDFWASYCSPCIRSLQKLEDAVQKLGSSDIALLGVYKDIARNALPTIGKRGWKSPSLVGDNAILLNDFFFSRSQIGHIIFIRDGKFYACPAEAYADETNLVSLLNGEDVPFRNREQVLHKRREVQR